MIQFRQIETTCIQKRREEDDGKANDERNDWVAFIVSSRTRFVNGERLISYSDGEGTSKESCVHADERWWREEKERRGCGRIARARKVVEGPTPRQASSTSRKTCAHSASSDQSELHSHKYNYKTKFVLLYRYIYKPY